MSTFYHSPHHEFEGSSFRTFLIYSLLVHLALLALFVWLRPQQATPGPMTVELREGVNLPNFDAPAPGGAASSGPTPQPLAPVPQPSAPTASAPRSFPAAASSYSTGSSAGSASGSRGGGGYSFPASPFPSQQRKNDPMGAGGFSTYSGSRQ